MEGFWDLSNEHGFSHNPVSANLDKNVVGGLRDIPLDHDSLDFSFGLAALEHEFEYVPFSKRTKADFAEEDSNAVLEHINQVLMEEDSKDEAYLIEDATLHAAEKPFYDILAETHCLSPYAQIHYRHSINSDATVSKSSGYCSNSHASANSLAKSEIFEDFCNSSHALNPPTSHAILSQPLLNCPLKSSSDTVDGPILMQASVNVPLESQFSSQLKWGMRENSKKVKADGEKDEDELINSLQHGRSLQDVSDLKEVRSIKQVSISMEESLLSEMIDTILHFNREKDEPTSNFDNGTLPKNGQAEGHSGGVICTKKRVNRKDHTDIKHLLIQCTQSVASSDYYTANKLLQQIKRLSSPSGSASQILGSCFAKGLEARLAGNGSLIYRSLISKLISSSDALEGYKLYGSTMPFMNASFYYVRQTMMELAKKATGVHIIQFGGMHGIHLVPIIQHLSNRPGGPPKLRITTIHFRDPCFEPTGTVEEARRRLGNYCYRFHVPFEYHCISQKWETVNPEDLKIRTGEVLVVMCLNMLHYLLDDSILENSPRDAVLKLIKRINPDIFIHGVYNASVNSPFFISRFREALSHYSVVFDMSEATMPRESPWRMVFETEIAGKEILNSIACEGLERIERPETYKQWQVRTLRIGFRKLPLSQEIIRKLKAKVKSKYHKDFFVDEADQWMIQGWKGRVLFALSCWKPN